MLDEVNRYGRNPDGRCRNPSGETDETDLLDFLGGCGFTLRAPDEARLPDDAIWPRVVRKEIIKLIKDAENDDVSFAIQAEDDPDSHPSKPVRERVRVTSRRPRTLRLKAEWPPLEDE